MLAQCEADEQTGKLLTSNKPPRGPKVPTPATLEPSHTNSTLKKLISFGDIFLINTYLKKKNILGRNCD